MSDHIPDVTKMISDTPRTDRNYIGMQIVPASFAQQLERELNAVSKERDEAVFVTEKVLKEFSEHSRSRCKAIDELNAANERIKRLEEAVEWISDELKVIGRLAGGEWANHTLNELRRRAGRE